MRSSIVPILRSNVGRVLRPQQLRPALQHRAYAPFSFFKSKSEGQAEQPKENANTEGSQEQAKESTTESPFEKTKKTFAEKSAGIDFSKLSSTFKEAQSDLIKSSGASRYGGWTTPEERQAIKERKKRLYEEEIRRREEYARLIEENPEAGTGITLHRDSTIKEAWKKFKENNSILQGLAGLHRDLNQSDNLLAHYFQRAQDSVASLFAESEHAQVVREIRMLEPTFNVENFLRDVQDYVIPEILEAFMKGDQETLKTWCSEVAFSVLNTHIQDRQTQGHVIDSKILELRQVELAMAKMIDQRPVLIVSFNTYQVTVMRDRDGKVIEGKEDQIEHVYYVMALVREPDMHPVTGGWKVIELGIQAAIKSW